MRKINEIIKTQNIASNPMTSIDISKTTKRDGIS